MTYSLRVVSDDREFAALEDSWNSLVSVAADANTFLTHAWLYTWWTSYQPRAALRIIVAERAGSVAGIAPMMLTREGTLGRVFRRLRFIGDGTSETDHMNFIVDASDRERIVSALLDKIEGLPWQLAHFCQMPESSQITQQLLRRCADRGWLSDTAIAPCPRCILPGTSEDLLKALPSRLRTAIRSASRQLASHHNVEFGMHEQFDELPSALETLYRNHAGRWQAKMEQGVFVDPRKRQFYSALSRKLLEAGALRFYYLKVDGAIIAQQFCFEHSGSVYLLQEGFDIAWAKQNVGNVLRFMVLEHLIAGGRQVYDFLAGMSRHKRHWSNAVTNDLLIRSFRPSLMGATAYGLLHLKNRMRQRRPDRMPAADEG